jgi:hypothetical protein
VLYPGSGTIPVAEGIAGRAPPQPNTETNIAQSLLMELCEDGKQLVEVTKVHKKNVPLMFPAADEELQCLDYYVAQSAPSNTCVIWSTLYLVEKETKA